MERGWLIHKHTRRRLCPLLPWTNLIHQAFIKCPPNKMLTDLFFWHFVQFLLCILLAWEHFWKCLILSVATNIHNKRINSKGFCFRYSRRHICTNNSSVLKIDENILKCIPVPSSSFPTPPLAFSTQALIQDRHPSTLKQEEASCPDLPQRTQRDSRVSPRLCTTRIPLQNHSSVFMYFGPSHSLASTDEQTKVM